MVQKSGLHTISSYCSRTTKLSKKSFERHEERVGAFKSLTKKLDFENQLIEAVLRERWELLQQMPFRPGELSPVRLAFRRERRNPALPILSQSGGEAEQAERQKQDKDKKRNQPNERKSKRVKKPPFFIPGQRILTSKYSTGNQDTAKILLGKVLQLQPNTRGTSAVIELDDGSTTVRNRKMCVLDPSQPQPDVVKQCR